MVGMSIQERYDEVSELSGLSEEIIRRVYKATRTSMVKSLKRGERATMPGLCTIIPELRSKLDLGGESVSEYIKLKATVSNTLETELRNETTLIKNNGDAETTDITEEVKLNFSNPELSNLSKGIRTVQISALL